MSLLFCQSRSMRAELDELTRKASVEYARLELKTIEGIMGPSQGHWYKCRNGHPYYVGDCGGLNQRGICIECKAPTGPGGGTLINSLDFVLTQQASV